MKKISIFFVLIFLLFSCDKIEPIKKNNLEVKTIEKKNNIEEKKENKILESSKNACGITSCYLKNVLNEKALSWEEENKKIKYYSDFLNNLLKIYPNKDKIIASKEFKIFVDKLNKDFFKCEGNIYKCKTTKEIPEDKLNYLFYIGIPKIVLEQNLEEKGWKSSEVETLIQAIKRKDFKSKLEKEQIILNYKQDLENKTKNIDFSKINKEKLKVDDVYFNRIFFNNYNGLFIDYIRGIYSIKIDWEEDDEIDRIAYITNEEFNKVLEKLGLTQDDFKNRIIEINNYEKNKNIVDSVIGDLEQISKKLNNKINFPTDRYFRNDELYIFDGINERTSEKLKQELFIIRNKVLLIFYFGEKDGLYKLPLRLKKYNFKEQFLLTNFFKYSKYIKKDNPNIKK